MWIFLWQWVFRFPAQTQQIRGNVCGMERLSSHAHRGTVTYWPLSPFLWEKPDGNDQTAFSICCSKFAILNPYVFRKWFHDDILCSFWDSTRGKKTRVKYPTTTGPFPGLAVELTPMGPQVTQRKSRERIFDACADHPPAQSLATPFKRNSGVHGGRYTITGLWWTEKRGLQLSCSPNFSEPWKETYLKFRCMACALHMNTVALWASLTRNNVITRSTVNTCSVEPFMIRWTIVGWIQYSWHIILT